MSDSSSPASVLSRIPPEIHCAQDYEALAQRFIAGPTYAYIYGGSGHDETLVANVASFAEWSIYPRLLRDVTAGNTRLTLAGRDFPHPIFLAPVAHQKLVHAAGELETARAAHAARSCMVTSTLSSCSLEEIAGAAGPDKWFQLYFQPSREVTLDLVRRAEAARYGAIVVTLDAAIQAPAIRALRSGFRMPENCTPANLQHYAEAPQTRLPAGESRILQGLMRHAPTLRDLEWLVTHTHLPVWVKGVLHREDACALRDARVAGLVVSNHGGRTLDGAPASLRVLPEIRAAVSDDYPLLFDSGIRSGSDIFKALALGADAVMVGRLQLYALSVAGALGVAHMIKLLHEELEACMAMTGCVTLADVRKTPLLLLRN